MAEFFEQKYRVRYSDAGVSGYLRPWMFFNLFQDTASVHAYNENVSAIHLAEKGLTWVVRAYSLEIEKLPAWNEEVRIKTWRFPFKNLYELRSYEVTGSSGQVFASAKSAWILVKLDSGQPARLSRNLPPDLASGPAIDFNIPEPPEPLPQAMTLKTFDVFGWDLDYNRHANNAVYIKWLIESLPSDCPESSVKSVEAVFMKSAYMDEKLECGIERKETPSGDEFLCRIYSPGSGQDILKARINCIDDFMNENAFIKAFTK